MDACRCYKFDHGVSPYRLRAPKGVRGRESARMVMPKGRDALSKRSIDVQRHPKVVCRSRSGAKPCGATLSGCSRSLLPIVGPAPNAGWPTTCSIDVAASAATFCARSLPPAALDDVAPRRCSARKTSRAPAAFIRVVNPRSPPAGGACRERPSLRCLQRATSSPKARCEYATHMHHVSGAPRY
jgi:hypothetical protein